MANYSSLLAAVNAAITANGTGAITGPVLNTVLQQMIVSLGQGGYIFKGRAIPTTDPGSPDQNVFYIATTAGTYTNFGSIVVAAGECAILKGSGTSWSKEATGIDLVSVSQNNLTGHTDINIGSDSYPVASVEEVYKYDNIPGKTLSASMEDIYTSETDNFLDVDNVAHGVYLDTRTNGTPTANAKGVISRFIYVKGVSQVTASGYVNSAYLGILFLSKPVLDIQYRTNYYQLTNTSRTIPVPANSLYAVVCLVEPDYDDDYDYSGVKLSFTSSAATQAYKGVYLGRAGYEYLFGKTIATANDIAEIPTIRKELDDIDSVSTKTISVTKNSVITQSASMLTLPVTIKIGSKYKACVRDTNGCVSIINGFYIVPKGSSEPVLFSHDILPNTFTPEEVANVEISAICIYCVAGSVVGSGDVVLSVYNGDLEIGNRVLTLEETLYDYNKKYTRFNYIIF